MRYDPLPGSTAPRLAADSKHPGTCLRVRTHPQHRLWPGELVNVRLLIDNRPNALTVPATAVQQGQHGSYVYAVKPDGTVELRTVQVAQLGPRRAVIDSGLHANEQVVIGGQSRLQPGSPVKILKGKAAQALPTVSARRDVPAIAGLPVRAVAARRPIVPPLRCRTRPRVGAGALSSGRRLA